MSRLAVCFTLLVLAAGCGSDDPEVATLPAPPPTPTVEERPLFEQGNECVESAFAGGAELEVAASDCLTDAKQRLVGAQLDRFERGVLASQACLEKQAAAVCEDK